MDLNYSDLIPTHIFIQCGWDMLFPIDPDMEIDLHMAFVFYADTNSDPG